ncbi:uncharacterized protein LOC129611290 [Condylostylus longicornis]|uniref:uncharacterized protein LOC129611290 n=1 Tax=Condylostylus longicornis TaxID=2530218 RepID=UPI00244DD2B2|nr:uncharacterized protein LOC129611290 [Condylostylus longicornis]
MTEPKKSCKLCEKMGLKPFTRDNVLHHYIPLTSLVSYGVLGINVVNPSFGAKLIPKKDVTNALLLSTIFGTTLYLYNRPHIGSSSSQKKVAYSALGSVLFSLGSVLLWAMIRSGVPNDNAALATVLGVGTGAAIVKIGTDYINDCDKLAK